MKFKHLILCALVLCVASCGGKIDSPVQDPEPGPDKPESTELKHPRILLNDSQLDAFKAKVTAGDEMAVLLHRRIMEVADKCVEPTAVLKYQLDASGRRLLGESRKAFKRITSCAYAWRYTGEEKYFKRAEEDLKTVINFPNWNATNHFLDAGEMSLAVAIAYDWLYSKLSSYVKNLTCEKVKAYAFDPALGASGFYSRKNNWNEVCNGGLIIAALALFPPDDDIVKTLTEKGVASNRTALENLYSPDGNYAESLSYWNYGTMYECFLLTVLQDIMGTDYNLTKVKGFLQTSTFNLFGCGPTGQYWTYSDFAEVEASSCAQWYFAWKSGDPSCLFNEMPKLRSGEYETGVSERFLPLLPAFAARMDCTGTGTPTGNFFSGAGSTPVAIARTGWGAEDLWLGIKGGTCATSHSHMDAGSFVYDAHGYRWSMDAPREDYAPWEVKMKEIKGDLWDLSQDSYRWDIFRYSNLGHSTLIAGGAKQKASSKATLIEKYSSGDKLGAKVNLTPVLQGQLSIAERTAVITGGHLEITDDMTARPDKGTVVRFQMLTMADAKVMEGGVELSQGNVRLLLSCNNPNVKYGVWTTDPAQMDYRFSDFEQQLPGTRLVGFELDLAASEKVTLVTTLK